MKQTVIPIDKRSGAAPLPRQTKQVPANQKAVDAIPLNSGEWRVDEIPGLYVRARAHTRSFVLQRRVDGELVKKVLGPMPLKQARTAAMKEWGQLKPLPAGGRKTLEQAFREFMQDGGKRGKLAETTRTLHEYNFDRYLSAWKHRALEDIGKDAECGRRLYRRLKEKHGNATAYQVIRLLSAVYNHARRVNRSLPECPTGAVTLAPIKKRDWALSPQELAKWWRAVEPGQHGQEIVLGVSTLGVIKRMWWLTALLTGASAASVEGLEWRDVDLTKRTILFRTAKGDRPYLIPMSDRLADLLTKYRDSGEVSPSRWVFPSPVKDDSHLVGVRNDKEGVVSAHHMRHTFRTVLAQVGASPDQARLLMGHSLGGDVSRNYITASLVVESLRPITNAASEKLMGMLGETI